MRDLKDKKLFLFDMDGVIYRGDSPIESAIESLKKLKELGKTVLYLTNNSTKTREQYQSKLAKMGLAAEIDDIHTSAIITARALNKKLKNGLINNRAYVVGESGLILALKENGFRILNEEYENQPEYQLHNLEAIPDEVKCDLVVMGWDRFFTFGKLRAAMMLIHRGSKFFVSNEDFSFPVLGTLWPGSGAQVAYLSAALGRRPDVIFGKPNPDGIIEILEHYNCSPNDAVLVGDRLDTDILGGNRAKMTTVLVETGINTTSDLENQPKETHPTFIFSDMTEMMQKIN